MQTKQVTIPAKVVEATFAQYVGGDGNRIEPMTNETKAYDAETPDDEQTRRSSHCYVAEVRKCIKTIESIYPSIAMYDEPRERLAYKVNTLIQRILDEDRRDRNCESASRS